MKRYIHSQEDIFAFAKLTSKYADTTRTGEILDFIYFSPVQAGHGPRIKFYDGVHKKTADSPYIEFGVDDMPTIDRSQYSRKDNPNVFDDAYVNTIISFVIRTRPILLLVWFMRLDQADALHYFEGSISWKELLDDIECDNQNIGKCNDYEDLHNFCEENNLYSFED